MDQVSLERRDGDRPPPLYTKAPHLTGIKRHVTFTRAFTIIATLTQKQHVIFGCVFRSRPREMGISLGKGGAWQRGGFEPTTFTPLTQAWVKTRGREVGEAWLMGDGESMQQGHTPRKVGRGACTSTTVHSPHLLFALTAAGFTLHF